MAQERYIQRHSLQTRITHDVVAISCIWLAISGLFVFIPPLGAAVGADVVQGMRMSHRIIGCIFILVPIISAITAPKGVKAFFGKYFTKWDEDDKTWMKKFIPYMFSPKKTHMPDADEVKSGQRVADGVVMIAALMMAASGLGLWLGGANGADAGFISVMRFLHDLFFLIMVVFVIAHMYLGAGIFQPYRHTKQLMWGNGQVSESDALYHWGKWARKEIEDGDKVVVKDE
jgi:formate dehydrogenase subunit gamma